MVTILHIDDIVSDPVVEDGAPTIVGTRIRMSDIAAYHIYDARRPEELAADFKLSLAQIHAALAYYYSHKAEIDTEIRDNSAEADRLIEQLKEQGRLIIFG